MDASVWDKLGDGLTSVQEGFGRFLTGLFGSSNERVIRSMGYVRAPKPGVPHTVVPGSLLAQINSFEDAMKALSEDDLRGVSTKLRERLAAGAKLEELLPEAFAACREAALRTKNMRHFDVQMVGGIVLHRGNIAEMVTGEGKTLVATLPAYLNALERKGVHVITVNDYLARRDCEWMLPIYRALGVTASYIQSDMDPVARREAYDCDITYGTNSEFGFDYLRDNMKTARRGDNSYDPYYQQVQRLPLNYAIIDEVDNILIDEARTPLIISGPAFTDVRRYDKANQIAVQLTDLQKHEPGRYFEIKEKEHTVHLTDEGVRKAEELAEVESFYTAGNMEWPHLIDNAMKAHHLYKRDKRYAVIRDEEEGGLAIVIIDEFTGRLMKGRQWSDGLHQAVEAKHARDGVKIKEETQTLATVTLQNFFRMYKKLAGMTGTAMTEADEFFKIYKLDVLAIPTNRVLIRGDSADVIYRTNREKWNAVVDEVLEVHKSGRPILIGTTDVDKSVQLSELLKRRGVKHELLNALPEHAAREADIVAQAGRIGSVTISTNMAGRGTDIILGGNPETMAWSKLRNRFASRLDVPEAEWKALIDEIEAKEKTKEEGRKVAGMGGLHIVGSERHEARRIDNQLRGRAGRQGDPGSSRFFLSLEDDLMRIFAGEWVRSLLEKLGMTEGQAIESRMVSRRISAAQKKVEEHNFDSRKSLLEYDEVMDFQRKEVYSRRQRLLEGTNAKVQILHMFDKQVALATKRFLATDYGAGTFAEFVSTRLSVQFKAGEFARTGYEEAERFAHEKATQAIATNIVEAIEENIGSEDKTEWNWQALAHAVNTRYGLKTTDRQLKQIGPDALSEYLIEEAKKMVDVVDLADGKPYLQADWGLRSLCDWARLQYGIKLTAEELTKKTEHEVRAILSARLRDLYREKEIEFPVKAGMAQFMSERSQAPQNGQKYNREGVFGWAKTRFPAVADRITEDDFRTQSRQRLQEILLDASKASYPAKSEELIDEQIDKTFEKADRAADADDARELAEWFAPTYGIPVTAEELTGLDPETIRQKLWNAFDQKFRPEMQQMERSLVLRHLDTSWKNHLYTMDHLRSGVGLSGYGQEDPKIVYKQKGMKEFGLMWEGFEDRVTETVFRMEESEDIADSIWAIASTTHEAAPTLQSRVQAQPSEQGSTGEVKKTEPIRNSGVKVGRNDPCPCGSGKKFKNCHARQTA
jgi:preprotein translocase subunit SecA